MDTNKALNTNPTPTYWFIKHENKGTNVTLESSKGTMYVLNTVTGTQRERIKA